MTQRNANCWWILGTGALLAATLGTGCMPMGANARRMAMNRQFNAENRLAGQRSPADTSRPTTFQESQRAAASPADSRVPNDAIGQYPFDPSAANASQSMREQVTDRQRMLGNGGMPDPASLAPPSTGNPMPIPGEGQVAPVAWQTHDNSLIPVAHSAAAQSPPSTGAHASLCDGNCQHGVHGQVAAPGEVLGLPAFRLPEMPEPSVLPGEESQAASSSTTAPRSQQRPAVQNPPSAPMPEAIAVAPPRTMQVTPGVASQAPPVAPAAAAPPVDGPQTSSRRTAANPVPKSPSTDPPKSTADSSFPSSSTPLQANVSMQPVRTTMQVRVTNDEPFGPPAMPPSNNSPSTSSRAPQPGLPAHGVSPFTQPGRHAALAKPAQAIEPPSPNAGQPASSAGIRVDSSLKSPWSQAPAAAPLPAGNPVPSGAPPAAAPLASPNPDQPAARILPFNSPSAPGNATSGFSPPPGRMDSQLKQAGHQQPMAPGPSTADQIPASFSAGRNQTGLMGSFRGMPLMGNPATTRSQGVTAAPERPAVQPLRASRPALTTDIRGFGDYEPMPSATLSPGQTVLVYCELENFVSSPVKRDGADAFRTMLESRLVVTDPSGRVVQDSRFPPLDDYAPSRRTDFFMYVPFEVGQLPAGAYQAQLEVRDLQGTSTQTAPVSFSVR